VALVTACLRTDWCPDVKLLKNVQLASSLRDYTAQHSTAQDAATVAAAAAAAACRGVNDDNYTATLVYGHLTRQFYRLSVKRRCLSAGCSARALFPYLNRTPVTWLVWQRQPFYRTTWVSWYTKRSNITHIVVVVCPNPLFTLANTCRRHFSATQFFVGHLSVKTRKRSRARRMGVADLYNAFSDWLTVKRMLAYNSSRWWRMSPRFFSCRRQAFMLATLSYVSNKCRRHLSVNVNRR